MVRTGAAFATAVEIVIPDEANLSVRRKTLFLVVTFSLACRLGGSRGIRLLPMRPNFDAP